MDVVDIINCLDTILNQQKVYEIGITLDMTLPAVVYMEGNLGIRKDCLKPLFVHTIAKLYTLKALYYSSSDDANYISNVISISRIVLIIKGDFPVAYEMRKKLIERGLCNVSMEIPLTALIFTRHPKCPSGWQHRRWCIAQRKHDGLTRGLSCSEIESERELCKEMAEKHPKNYYAWVHRLWLLPFMLPNQLDDELQFTSDWLVSHVSDHSAVNHRIQVLVCILSHKEALDLVLATPQELNIENSKKEARRTSGEIDTGENSGEEAEEETGENLHENKEFGRHREQITASGDTPLEKKVMLLKRMFQECTALLQSRPGHESLWYLRRSLLEMLMMELRAGFNSYTKNCASNSQSATSSKAGKCNSTVSEFDWARLVAYIREYRVTLGSTCEVQNKEQFNILKQFVQAEMVLVRMCSDEEVIVWDTAAQRKMATRYGSFLADRIHYYWGYIDAHA